MNPSAWQYELSWPWCLAALLVLPLLMHYWRRSLVGVARWRQCALLGCRSLLVVLLVAALSGIEIWKPDGRQFAILAVDGSLSVAEESREAARAFVDKAVERAESSQTAVIPFAAQPGSVAALPMEEPELDPRGSNLAAAVEVARAWLPPDRVPQIVLLSDGCQTEGDLASAAASTGVPVSTVPLQSDGSAEVYVDRIGAKRQVQRGEPFYIDVTIRSNHADEGTLELHSGQRTVARRQVQVIPGENRFRFARSIAAQAAERFTARIGGFKDRLSENNEASCLVFATAKPRVLLVENELLLGRHLAEGLKDRDIDVVVRPPSAVPKSLAELRGYELVILSNVPAAALPQERMEAIRGYVRDFGGGLIVIGGDHAFTPGGYRRTTLEEVLPVWCDPNQQRQKPGLAMVLVIDRSNSMTKGGAIELAKEATRRAVAMLGPNDQLGVIAFEETSDWVSPLRPLTDKPQIIERINTIEPGEGTEMYPAVEKAYLALNQTFAPLKHMIILTDGLSHPGDFQSLASEIARAGITVSTVGVGPEVAVPLLQDIARIGRGHFYYCAEPAAIPKIFALDTASAGKLGISEQPFVPQVVHRERFLDGVDFRNVPLLWGHVETRPKPSGRVVLATKEGAPLLVWWRYGLGVSAVFTSDIQSRWAADWLKWSQFDRLWTQLARHAMRKDQARDFLLDVRCDGHHATVSLEAVDPSGRFLNNARAVLTVVDPEQKTRELPVDQIAPGRYATRLATPAEGAYCLELSLTADGRTVFRQRAGLVVGYADEFKLRPADAGLLRSVAEQTGGRYDPAPTELFAPTQRKVVRAVAIWPYLLTGALLVFVLDIGLRRLVVVRRQAAEAGSYLPPPAHFLATKTGNRLVGTTAAIALGLAVFAWLAGQEPPTTIATPQDTAASDRPQSPPADRPIDPAAAIRLRAELAWKVAPPARVLSGRVETVGPSLDRVAAELETSRKAAPKVGLEEAGTPKSVIEAELLPLEYRRTIRRYFESIRPDGTEPRMKH